MSKFSLAKIERIERRQCSRPVFNLAVKDDESYIAEDVVVHNCRSVLIPITKDEGPLLFITPGEVGDGLSLRGTGF